MGASRNFIRGVKSPPPPPPPLRKGALKERKVAEKGPHMAKNTPEGKKHSRKAPPSP